VIVDNRVRFATLQKKVDEYAKYVEELEVKATVRGNLLQMVEKILVRAYHLELHAEYLSIGFPPMPDATLPNLTFRQWCHWYNVVSWCNDEEDQKKNEELQKKYWDHADATGDFRIPNVHALINGKRFPHPPGPVIDSKPLCYLVSGIEFRHLCHLPVDNLPDYPTRRGKRAISVTPNLDATHESNEDEVYWIEPAQQQQQ
jgi:hypothetical protein